MDQSELVQFEGAEVDSILDGQEQKDEDGKVTAYFCRMSDGTSKFVPAELFEGRIS